MIWVYTTVLQRNVCRSALVYIESEMTVVHWRWVFNRVLLAAVYTLLKCTPSHVHCSFAHWVETTWVHTIILESSVCQEARGYTGNRMSVVYQNWLYTCFEATALEYLLQYTLAVIFLKCKLFSVDTLFCYAGFVVSLFLQCIPPSAIEFFVSL